MVNEALQETAILTYLTTHQIEWILLEEYLQVINQEKRALPAVVKNHQRLQLVAGIKFSKKLNKSYYTINGKVRTVLFLKKFF